MQFLSGPRRIQFLVAIPPGIWKTSSQTLVLYPYSLGADFCQCFLVHNNARGKLSRCQIHFLIELSVGSLNKEIIMHGAIFDKHFLIFSLKFSTNNCFVFFIRRIFLYPAKGKDIVRVWKTDQSPLAMKVFPNWVSNKKGFTFARPISLSLSLTRTHYLSWTLILLLSLSLSSLRHSISFTRQ